MWWPLGWWLVGAGPAPDVLELAEGEVVLAVGDGEVGPGEVGDGEVGVGDVGVGDVGVGDVG
ncbi:hypothetical protein VM95_35695, partial [Streptomyces rubellomurinus]